MLVGFMFHYFHDEKEYKKTQGSIGILDFENFIIKNSEKIINPFQINDNLILSSETYYVITFDDGLKIHKHIVDTVLEKHNIKALFNINTNHFVNKFDNLELFRNFRNEKFEIMDNFYNLFFDIVEKKKQIKLDTYFRSISNYLTKSNFYTFNDKKFRYLRDVILSESEYADIMFDLIEIMKYDYQKKDFWLNTQDIKKISDLGHAIGLHSHSHSQNLVNQNYENQYKDFCKNKKILESIIQQPITFGSYPFGKYNSKTIKVFENLGIKYSFIAFDEHNHLYKKNLEIPRIDSNKVGDFL